MTNVGAIVHAYRLVRGNYDALAKDDLLSRVRSLDIERRLAISKREVIDAIEEAEG